MKKTIYLSLIASLFTTLVSAADLYVRDLGAGGAYTTITDAINAAADGDRIIIKPKDANAPYLENLVINKSLTFICENNFEKYLVQGTVSITPLAGRVVSIHNIRLLSNITVSAATIGGRTTLNIMNCIANNVLANQINTTLNISGCEVAIIDLNHGKVTGNKCNNILAISSSIDTNLATEDIEVIANKISGNSGLSQLNYNFKFLNNYSLGSFDCSRIKSTGTNEIFNNVIRSTVHSITISASGVPNALTNISNNILSAPTGQYEIYNGATSTIVYAYHNFGPGPETLLLAGLTISVNNNPASLTFSGFTVTGQNINNGLANDEFIDLDLSRNDVGNYGGSNSWENYWPTAVSNKPQVNYLNTPRKIFTGTTTMTAKASGYSK